MVASRTSDAAPGSRPSAASDVAKLIVWSFLAGFAERLVPDALDRIVSQSQSPAVTKPPIK